LALILVRKAHISINYKHFSLCCIIVAFFKNASILIKYLFFLIKRKKYEIARISHFIQNSKNNNTINSV
jgi:hypothetical protein